MMSPYFLPFEYPARVRQRTHSVWVAPVSSKQEKIWGTLVAVITLPTDTTLADRTLADLRDLLTRLYYPSATIANAHSIKDTAAARETQFEEMLQELNAAFQNLERFGIPPNGRDEFDMLVSVIHEDGILLASHSRSQAWFLRRFEPTETQPERFEQISEASRGENFFSSVVNGSLRGGETLLFVTDEFFASWSEEMVIHLIDTAKSTEELIEVLHRQAQEQGATAQAAALIILGLDPEETADTEPVETIKAEEEQPRSRSSAERSRKSTTEVAVFVTPLIHSTAKAIWIGARWSAKSAWMGLQRIREASVHLPSLWRSLVRGLTSAAAVSLRATLMAWSFLWTITLLFALGVAIIVHNSHIQESITAQIRREPAARAMNLASSSSLILSSWAKSLSLLLIIFVVAAGAFVVRAQYNRTRQQEANQAIALQNKTTEAQSRLIYGNDREAQQLLDEARQLLSTLPQKDGDTKTKTIRDELDTLAHQLRHEVELPNPIVRIPAPSTSQKIASIRATLAVASDTAVAVYAAYNLAAKPVPKIIALPSGHHSPNSIELLNETNLLVHEGSSVYRVSLNGKGSVTASTLPPAVGPIRATFNNRVYAIDAMGTSILRLNPTGSGWGLPATWLIPPSTLLANPKGIDIDGAVYVVGASAVGKYYRGQTQPFAFTIDPPLADPRSIIADPDSPYLFILDGTEHPRIIVVNKGSEKTKEGGRVLAQLVHPGWKVVHDIALDAKKKTLTVLADGFIEQYAVPALK